MTRAKTFRFASSVRISVMTFLVFVSQLHGQPLRLTTFAKMANAQAAQVTQPQAALGAVPGTTAATAIDPQGHILGTYSDSGGVTHGFLLSNGVLRAVPDIPAPGSSTYPLGMNPQGDIVGVALGVTPCCGFLLSQGTVYRR